VINSPTPARCLYISSYISDTHPPPPPSTGTLIQRWISTETNLFDIYDDPKRRFFNHVADNLGLSPNTTYYFRVTYISGVATTKEYTEITTRNGASIATDRFGGYVKRRVGLEGSFTTVSIYYNTSGTFTTSDASLSGIATRTHTVSGLSANTLLF
jgi:hypothetical protein